MELCWLTTGRCNQKCNYCDRFHSTKDLKDKEYFFILDKIIRYDVKHLTFGGGESLLINCFEQIVKKASDNGIHLKLVTNGQLIPLYDKVLKYLDEITLSIDSVDDIINDRLGRGVNHRINIENAIKVIRTHKNICLNINTVATKINLNRIMEMRSEVEKWNISKWRIFRFCPLRGTAIKNQSIYEISENEFQNLIDGIHSMNLNCNIQFRNYDDMEKKYLLINPEGKLCISKDMKDTVVGDMLKDDLRHWFA